jgi:Ser/Thr protein kinase RdoA (MazF antagonist)
MPDSVPDAAVRAAVKVAAGLGVSSFEPVVLADGANVIVHLRPSPVVAKVAASTTAVRLETDAWLQRELNVVEFLAAAGVPVMTPSPEMPATTYHGDGHVMSFWRFLRSAGGEVPPEATIGSMLRDLHATLRSYPGTLPVLAPLNDIPAFLARPQSQLSAGEAGALSAAYARLTAELDQILDQILDQTSPAVQVLHGDAGPGNLMNTDTGWVWHDFEDTCAGPVGWDLAASTASRRLDRSRILAAYGAPVDPGQLAVCEQLRWLHLTIWYNLYAERLPDLRPRAAQLLAQWTVGDNPPGGRTEP